MASRILITVQEANGCWPRHISSVMPVPECGCFLWTKALNEHGRGMVRISSTKSMVQAHRLAWVYATQAEIPATLDVLHTCDVGSCVNPKHLYLGTHADNIADKHRRGRGASGYHLTKAHYKRIQTLYKAGWKYAELQTKFQVSHTTILRALNYDFSIRL